MGTDCKIIRVVEDSRPPRYEVQFKLSYNQFWALHRLLETRMDSDDHENNVADAFNKALENYGEVIVDKIAASVLNDKDEL